jgi:iron-sulfur cluster repair protein YtfE (RIC family)
MKICKDITIGEVIRNYPKALEVLDSFGLSHVSSAEVQLEKIGQACEERGVQVEELIDALKENVESEIRDIE